MSGEQLKEGGGERQKKEREREREVGNMSGEQLKEGGGERQRERLCLLPSGAELSLSIILTTVVCGSTSTSTPIDSTSKRSIVT